MRTPPCTRYEPQLFDSTRLRDHIRARAVCSTCPVVQGCIARAVAIAEERPPGCRRGPDGTWGGLLWTCGTVRTPAAAECGTASGYRRHRTLQEPACAACKAAHVREVA